MAKSQIELVAVINNRYLIIICVLLSVSCKQHSHDKKIELNTTESEPLERKQETENKTVTYNLNLTMEWVIRLDELKISENTINGSIKQKADGIDDDFTTIDLERKEYSEDRLAALIKSNLRRTEKKEEAQLLLKVIKPNDTIMLYSYSLSDRSRFIREYFTVMKLIYPDDENFEYPEIH
jgi:hypothetical protein